MADSHREEIAKLESLYANNPEGRVFTHLAEAYRKAGELERAQEILQDGLTRHADYSSAHVVLGRVLMDMGEPERARGAFRRVLELDRHNLIALRALGDLAEQAGERTEALNYYRELLSLDPSDDRLRLTIVQLEQEPAPVAVATEPAPEAVAEAPPEPTPKAEPIVESAAAAELDLPVIEEPAGPEAAPVLNWEEEVGEGQEPLPGDLGVLASAPTEAGASDEAEDLDLGWLPAGATQEPERHSEEEQEASEFVGFETGAWSSEDEPGAADWGEPVTEAQPVEAKAGWGLIPETSEPSAVSEAEAAGPAEHAEQPEHIEAAADPHVVEVPRSYASLPSGLRDDVVEQPEEVFTETIAELYTAQGLHERAAEVYRSLLTGRPDDDHLRARLRDSEAAVAAASRSAAAPDVPVSEREIFDSMADHAEAAEPVSWLEGVESAWTGGSGVAGSGPTPYAWTDTSQAEEVGDGKGISEYFRELLAWRHGAGGGAGAEEEGYAGDLLLMDEVVEPDSVADEEVVTPTAELEGTPSEEEVRMDWAEAVREETPHDVAPEPAETTEEDEDLEMFRSWLQSLKK